MRKRVTHLDLDGKRIEMAEGEAWYLNFNLYHSVRNKGTAARIHLVIDCKVNEWFRSLFLLRLENGSPL